MFSLANESERREHAFGGVPVGELERVCEHESKREYYDDDDDDSDDECSQHAAQIDELEETVAALGHELRETRAALAKLSQRVAELEQPKAAPVAKRRRTSARRDDESKALAALRRCVKWAADGAVVIERQCDEVAVASLCVEHATGIKATFDVTPTGRLQRRDAPPHETAAEVDEALAALCDFVCDADLIDSLAMSGVVKVGDYVRRVGDVLDGTETLEPVSFDDDDDDDVVVLAAPPPPRKQPNPSVLAAADDSALDEIIAKIERHAKATRRMLAQQ